MAHLERLSGPHPRRRRRLHPHHHRALHPVRGPGPALTRPMLARCESSTDAAGVRSGPASVYAPDQPERTALVISDRVIAYVGDDVSGRPAAERAQTHRPGCPRVPRRVDHSGLRRRAPAHRPGRSGDVGPGPARRRRAGPICWTRLARQAGPADRRAGALSGRAGTSAAGRIPPRRPAPNWTGPAAVRPSTSRGSTCTPRSSRPRCSIGCPRCRAAHGYRDDGLVSREAHHLCRGALDRFFTDGERREAARVALRRCAELGVGAVHDLGGPHLGPVDGSRLGSGDAADELGPRVVGYWGELAEARPASSSPAHTRCAGWPATCASTGRSAPAPPRCARTTPTTRRRGVRYLDDDEIRDHLVACTRAGLQAGFHCIGDDAVSAAVQGLRRAAEIVGAPALRAAGHRLEHVEMVDADDLPSLADLSVTASVQPAFDAAWGTPGELYEQRLGPRAQPADEPVRLACGAPVCRWPSVPTPRSRRSAGWAMVDAAVRHSRVEEQLSPPRRVRRRHPRRTRRGGGPAGGSPRRRAAGGAWPSGTARASSGTTTGCRGWSTVTSRAAWPWPSARGSPLSTTRSGTRCPAPV